MTTTKLAAARRDRVRHTSLAAVVLLIGAHTAEAQFAEPAGGGSDGTSPVGQAVGGATYTPLTDQVVNSGIGVRLIFVGRNANGKEFTVSAEVRNVTEQPAYVALVGPAPAAIDTNGVTYRLATLAGLAACPQLETRFIRQCMENNGVSFPGDAFSLLQPGAAAIVAITFSADEVSDSGFLSLTMNVALGLGTRPTSSRDRASSLENIAISFPLVALSGS
ncbi:MAG: hypothetical protein V2I43_09765 [Parvularcula sp.]|jgi:hypothetical protein|nr:hypothetical protein [Parvularcula sp.]